MVNSAVSCLFAITISFLITFYLIPILRNLAFRLKFLDRPDGKIKNHIAPIPYLGGVAIYFGFLCALALTLSFKNNIGFMLIGSTLLLIVGLIDDLFVLKPYQKLFGQCLAVFIFLHGGFFLKEQFFLRIWHIPLSFFWMLSITNAFNLIDVMDGLAATTAIMGGAAFFCIALLFNQLEVAVLLAALIGSNLAFLWYNRPNATIYLGDAGSLFVGGVLSVIPFFLNWSSYSPYGYLASLVVLAIPLLELGTLIIVRTYKRIPFYRGSRDHFSCYLQDNGWSKGQILSYVFCMSLITGISSILFATNSIDFSQIASLAAPFLVIWIAFLYI